MLKVQSPSFVDIDIVHIKVRLEINKFGYVQFLFALLLNFVVVTIIKSAVMKLEVNKS